MPTETLDSILNRFPSPRSVGLRLDKTNLAAALLLATFFLLSFTSAIHKTLTADEGTHYKYGLRILNLNSNRLHVSSWIDDSKMPFTALNALPSKLGALLPDGWLKRYSGTIQAGRPATEMVSVLFAFLVFSWARSLYGSGPALLSLLLYVLEPSIIANSHFVTTDIYAMGMVFASVFALWRLNQRPSAGRLLCLAVVVGLSQAAKYSAVFLVPILILAQLAHDLPNLWTWAATSSFDRLKTYVCKRIVSGSVVALVGLVTLNVCYFFNRTLMPIQQYEFSSSLFKAIQARVAFLGWLPVPVPFPYLQGLDLVNFRDEAGFGYGRIYILGHLSSSGIPGFYFLDILIKTPLPILLAFLLGLIALATRRRGWAQFLRNESFLLLPIIWYLVWMDFMLHAQLGIRLILAIFPFMFIIAGNLVVGMSSRGLLRRTLIGALGLWLAVSVLRFYPHFLPYTSDIVLDKRTAYAYVTDSDFEWHQSKNYLKAWLEEHPTAIMDPPEPVSGLIVGTPSRLVGMPRTQDPDKYAWLRDNFTPVDVIAFTYPVFRVTDEDIKRLAAKTLPP